MSLLGAFAVDRDWIPVDELDVHYLEEVFLGIAAIMLLHLGELAWLFREVDGWVGEAVVKGFRDATALTSAAEKAGLTMVWPSRNQALQSEVGAAIEHSKHRVLLLGIAFQEVVPIRKVLETVTEKDPSTFDFRVLLLDPYRSPAVFRTLLESDHEGAAEIMAYHSQIGAGAEDIQLQRYGSDPLLDQRLYTDFNSAVNTIKGYRRNPIVKEATRFYGHSPTCWMIIVDDVMYFQPYSYGRSPKRTDRKKFTCIGVDLPVFRFDGRGETFRILSDHFEKLWLTSQTDLDLMQDRIDTKESIIRKIFGDRRAWLEHVWGQLFEMEGAIARDGGFRDRRQKVRAECQESPHSLVLQFGTDESEVIPVKIHDYSREGLGLEVEHVPAHLVEEGLSVTVRMDPTEDETEAATLVLNKVLGRSRARKFVVRNARVRGSNTTVGLEATPAA